MGFRILGFGGWGFWFRILGFMRANYMWPLGWVPLGAPEAQLCEPTKAKRSFAKGWGLYRVSGSVEVSTPTTD